MADEGPTTISAPLPSWVGGTDEIVKMLLQSQRPAATQAPAEDETNPWLKALGADTPSIPQLPVYGTHPAMIPPKVHDIHPTLPKTAPSPLKIPPPIQVAQVPVQSLMQMQQHQVSPAVEAAKQRVLQVLMQRPHGIPVKG